jgi:hypothetical protein
MKIWFLFLAGLLIGGVLGAVGTRYEVTPAGNLTVYRLDRWSGTVHYMVNGEWKLIESGICDAKR